MKWTDIPVHVIDFEGSRRTGVVEFGVVTLAGGACTAAATRLCRPRAAVPVEDMRVHGLAETDLAAAEPFATEWTRFAALRATGVLAAHFSATEHGLLRAEWPAPRLSPDFLQPPREVAEWGPWIDTGRLAIDALPPGAPAGLAAVVTALGLADALATAATRWCPPERRRFHCALYDALACALALQVLACEPVSREPWSLARVLTTSTADARGRDERQQARWF